MKGIADVFCEVPCLTERSVPLKGIEIYTKWLKKVDKRIMGENLHKFIQYNITQFNFLDVQPEIIGTDKSIALVFRTSKFIGSIPLRGSDTGKQIGDFVVSPKFEGRDKFEEYIELLNLLGEDISPEFNDSLPLVSGRNFRPPLYLEALKFVSLLEELTKQQWRKFDNVEKFINQPVGQVNWKKYINNEFKVENRLKFPVNKNTLNQYHRDYSKIRYVFDICKGELLSPITPVRIKSTLRARLDFLDERLCHHKPIGAKNIEIRFSDNQVVRACKVKANNILSRSLVDGTAWRVDFANVFEKFIQHIFLQVAKKMGGSFDSNLKIPADYKRFSWQLSHIEPDGVLRVEDTLFFIDAKYKSNLYNQSSDSKFLKEDHRHDLHQILAYTAFGSTDYKYGFLCYPSNSLKIDSIKFQNNINESCVEIFVMGVPPRKDSVPSATEALIDKLAFILK